MLSQQHPAIQQMMHVWRQDPRGNTIAAIFRTPNGRFLLARDGNTTWGLPAARGHGPRLDYLTPMSRLAQHFGVTLPLQTLQYVDLIQGDERVIVISFDLSEIPGFTPADGRWVSPGEVQQLKNVSDVVARVLLTLNVMLTEAGVTDAAEVPASQGVEDLRLASRRTPHETN